MRRVKCELADGLLSFFFVVIIYPPEGSSSSSKTRTVRGCATTLFALFFFPPRWVPGRLVYPVKVGLGLFASAWKTIVSVLNRGRMWEASLEAVRTRVRKHTPSPDNTQFFTCFLSCYSNVLLCCFCKQRFSMSGSSIFKDLALKKKKE